MSMNIQTNNNHHHEAHVADVHKFGFWLFIMTDVILFASLFATFIVLSANVVPNVFNMNYVLLETIILLTSSFTFGLSSIMANAGKTSAAITFAIITFLLGAAFLYLELHEFVGLVSEGKTLSYHAYFSAFFILLGTHGLHVFVGLCWMIVLLIQISCKGFDSVMLRKFTLLGLFWHFLDAVWIFVFSIVYLSGAL